MEKKKKISIAALVIGLIALVAGVIFLIVKLVATPAMQDGEYLTSAENWTLDGQDGVIWAFTEIGKGTLTTNNHTNDYDFIWSLEDEKLKIETDWLYTLENEYEYTLDQGSGTLILKDGETEYKLQAHFPSE